MLEACRVLPALDFLRVMETARQGDRREGILLRQSRGWFSVAGMGQEPIGVLAYALRPTDWTFPYYRDRAFVLARGMTTRDLALAFYAREASCSAGRQMPGHHGCRSLRLCSVPTPTGAQCLPAVGAAWAAKRSGSDDIVMCMIGDAALRQGEYYEAIAFAIQETLPLVMVIEDNGFGISTATVSHNPYRLGVLDDSVVVRPDARDPEALLQAGLEAADRARRREGPTVLWCEVDRIAPHTSSDDHRVYRSPEDLAQMEARDPIPLFASRLIAAGVLTEADWEAMRREIAEEVEDAYLYAESSPTADPATLSEHVCAAPTTPPEVPGVVLETLRGETGATIVGAINAVLGAALSRDDRVILFGEDIEDPKGGVFGLTKGLSTAFPGRVVNSPLAEATILGIGVGLAATGARPVVEVQFIDFIGPAFNQLTTQVATLRWRTAGDQACPLVMIAPCGAYLPGGGIWHSQTNEGFWAHIPGLRVGVPSTPTDAAGMLWTALAQDDPVLLLIPKHVFRKRMPVAAVEAVEIGRAVVRRAGTDVTLVTWGNCTELADECADTMHDEGVSVEILDLRWISPCDWEAIVGSVARTGRLVVLQEDSRTGGFADTIVAEMTSRPDRWDLFLAAPQIVARLDTPVPFAPSLEYAVLPDRDDVLRALRSVLQ